MESVELSIKKKRIKHCFLRSEIYHQWIHSPEYYYTNQRYDVSSHYDMLFSGSINENKTRQQFVDDWYYLHRNRCIAIINREFKLIIINLDYERFYYEFRRDIPDDYQIFITKKPIDNPNILSTGEVAEAVKLYAEYLVSTFVECNLSECYSVLNGFRKTLNVDPRTIFKYNKTCTYGNTYYNHIINFVNKYNIKKTDWYNIPFKDTVCINNYNSKRRYKEVKIELPSIKQIVTNKVFKPKENIKLAKAYFYTKYCYGYGISMKILESRWNDEYDKAELEKLLKKYNIHINLDNRHELLLFWRDGIKLYSKLVDEANNSAKDRAIKQSEDNYNKALEELKEEAEKYNINSWRNYQKYNRTLSREYERFIPSYRKHGYGKWKTCKVFNNITFPNTILRIKNNIIETSRHAYVSLEDAIKMYKLFLNITKHDICKVGTKIYHKLDHIKYNVGKFNLRAIIYQQKKTDDGVILDKWEYVIVIGCHYLWMDDFYDFINYYNLYKEFNITSKD